MATAIVDDGLVDDAQEVHRLLADAAPLLRATLRRLTWRGAEVDDMLQDVFVIALKRKRAVLNADSPRSWLYGIAVNVASERRRSHKLWSFLGLESTRPLEARGDPHAQLERAQSEAVLTQALEQLSDRKREVFVLFELEGLTGPEIAQALGCSVNTVWTRLFHARQELAAICREATEVKR
jgi:RNA polymerase sigma-70 factor (ECF subfamily)